LGVVHDPFDVLQQTCTALAQKNMKTLSFHKERTRRVKIRRKGREVKSESEFNGMSSLVVDGIQD